MVSTIFALLALSVVTRSLADLETKAKLRAQKLPPCAACKVFVAAFKKRVDATARGKYEGGDTAWEESHQLEYQKSELRLIEIQEKLCEGIGGGEDQCIANAEEFEPMVEQWWFHNQVQEPDLMKWLCIEQLKVCCPPKHYGPECNDCPGFPDDICSGSGKCDGAGTRTGTGHCTCDKGYTGDKCSECSDGFYQAYKDDKKLVCSPCYVACEGTCSGPGAKGCTACKSGWDEDKQLGCVDINECLEVQGTCQANQFCVNNEGSYSCLECDRSCNGCTGDGPDMCIGCTEGYSKHQGVCLETAQVNQNQQAAMTRYLTYLGLCIATFIIFNKNTWIAMIIGAMVSIYITVSEYMFGTDVEQAFLFVKQYFNLFGSSS